MRWRKIYPLEMPDIFQNVREILDFFFFVQPSCDIELQSSLKDGIKCERKDS